MKRRIDEAVKYEHGISQSDKNVLFSHCGIIKHDHILKYEYDSANLPNV